MDLRQPADSTEPFIVPVTAHITVPQVGNDEATCRPATTPPATASLASASRASAARPYQAFVQTFSEPSFRAATIRASVRGARQAALSRCASTPATYVSRVAGQRRRAAPTSHHRRSDDHDSQDIAQPDDGATAATVATIAAPHGVCDPEPVRQPRPRSRSWSVRRRRERHAAEAQPGDTQPQLVHLRVHEADLLSRPGSYTAADGESAG